VKPSEFEHLDCISAAWPDDTTFSISIVRSLDDKRLHIEVEWDGVGSDRSVRVPLDVPAELGAADGVWEAIARHVEAGQ
jgi:hypothetical protein